MLLSLRSQKRVAPGTFEILTKKNIETRGTTANLKTVFLTIFQLLDGENYEKRYLGAFRGVENWKSVRSRLAGGLLEAQRATCGSILGPLQGLMGSWRAP